MSSLMSLSPSDLVGVALDPAGSRVLEAVLLGPAATREDKAGLMRGLRGGWGEVAMRPAGSFFLEKAYHWTVRGFRGFWKV
jgi:hypothetical protein